LRILLLKSANMTIKHFIGKIYEYLKNADYGDFEIDEKNTKKLPTKKVQTKQV
jgi:hypothetical protein